MKVRSAVDLSHKLVALGVFVLMLVCFLLLHGIWRFVLTVPVVALLFWIYLGTYYELRDEYLYCRSGPFAEKIRYEDIKSAKLCMNFYSSMALSMKRIEIKVRKKGRVTGTTYISPVNRKKFLLELIARCQNLDRMEMQQS